MSSKKTTTTNQTTANSLPSWLTTPYQNATASATSLAAQPAISAGTQTSLNNLTNDGSTISSTGNTALTGLSNQSAGNFTGSTAGNTLTNLATNGGLDTSYIDQSGLNQTASGAYLDPSTNPYITSVANQAADAAQSRINAQFGAAGRSNGSGLYAQLFGQGITNASDQVYAQNYQNERTLQQQAQDTLLAQQGTTRENALNREASSAGTLLGAQQTATGQLPSIMSAILGGDSAALSAGEYSDKAGLNQLQQYAGILSGLAAPYGISNTQGKTTSTTSGLGSTLGTIAQLGGAASSLLGSGGISSLSSFFTPKTAASGLSYNDGTMG